MEKIRGMGKKFFSISHLFLKIIPPIFGLKKSREFDGRYWEGIEINKARFELLQKSYKGEFSA
ncbi:MAG TPA: hypothetical protein PLK11_08245 [Methanofastidiosum sp.]|nr:hypothetical protein [Methanofastidiosum sp.]HOR88837.1 hypothetical protein [Methanofastidiosum sp.]HPL01315.1 hypothetical protein [Methanofastidiosum sp.]